MTKVDILFPCSQAMEMFKKQEGEQQICSNRFVSERTIGGHMTAQNSGSMASNTLGETEFQKEKRPSDSDDESMKMKNVEEGLYGNGSNLMDALRRNPECSLRFADRDYLFQLDHGFDSNQIDSSLNCDLGREEFSSLMCQTETHQDSGDAHLEESESQSQKHETQDQEEERSESEPEIKIDHPSGNSSKIDKWMKPGKRFKKPRYETQLNPRQQFCYETNTEEEDMAICLVMLASGVHTAQTPQFQLGADEIGSTDFKLPSTGSQRPKCIKKKPNRKKIDGDCSLYDDEKVKKASHKCITCNKVFHSYQALGGHRASHNKVKSCCVSQIKEQNESLEEEITTDEKLITGSDSQQPGNFHRPCPKKRTKDPSVKDMDETMTSQPGKKSRVHICSICHRVFASGQALGGHKRCHWDIARASDSINTISSSKDTPVQKQQMPARLELLDLNLPAPVDDDSDAGNLNHVDGNAVDSLAQTHSSTQLSKDDEAYSNVGKEIGFGRDCDSEFPVRAESWLQL